MATETLHPGRRIVLELPLSDYGTVAIAILDSPTGHPDPISCAALLVPAGEERNWIYTSEGGQWQLLATANVTRLVIISRTKPDEVEAPNDGALETRLRSVVVALAPRVCFRSGALPVVPFLEYSDDVLCRVLVEEIFSPLTGWMLVEDVSLCEHDSVVFRRRLRFKRMPNLIQTEVALVVKSKGHVEDVVEVTESVQNARGSVGDVVNLKVSVENVGGSVENLQGFVEDATDSRGSVEDVMRGSKVIDHGRLVHKYLAPIVAGLVLAAGCIEPCLKRGESVRVVALGVGGGALPIFLQKQLGFHVQAVDIDTAVLDAAHRHFGLENSSPTMEVTVADALQFITKLATKITQQNTTSSNSPSATLNIPCHRVHAIIVDIDEGDPRCGLSSPPSSFLEEKFLREAKSVLFEGGLLAMNVVPNGKFSYSGVVASLSSVFGEFVYETGVEGDVNRVVFALSGGSVGVGVNVEGPLAKLVRRFLDVGLITAIQKAPVC